MTGIAGCAPMRCLECAARAGSFDPPDLTGTNEGAGDVAGLAAPRAVGHGRPHGAPAYPNRPCKYQPVSLTSGACRKR